MAGGQLAGGERQQQRRRTRLTASAHLSRCHRSGSSARFHRASGPTPIRNTSGVISGTNTVSKYGRADRDLAEVQRVEEQRVERAEQHRARGGDQQHVVREQHRLARDRARSGRRRRPWVRAARTAASEPPMTSARKARMNTPRRGSVANACTDVSTPERTRNVPSSDSENAQIASSTVHALKVPRFSVTASEWISAVPMQPGHERRVLDRVPEPPAAPAELVVRPPAAEHDAAGEEAPRERRPRPRPARPRGVEPAAEQRRDREREGDREPDVAHVEQRRMEHHARVLQQRVQVAAVGGAAETAGRTGST